MVLTRVAGRALVILGIGLCLLCAAASRSRAAPEAPDVGERREQAAQLADEGFALLKRGSYEQALQKFKQADETLHSPVFVLFMARAEAARGRLLSAQTLLRKVIDEPLADYAPDTFWQAKRDAEQDLAHLKPRLPQWRLNLREAQPSEVQVMLDGAAVDPALVRSPTPIDPGQHLLLTTSRDGRAKRVTFTAVEGETTEVEVALGPVVSGAESPQPQPPPPVESTAGISRNVPIAIAYGIGGAGLLVGLITGAVFIDQAGDLKDRCNDDHCPADAEEDGDSVRTLGDVSTAAWIIGGLGAAAGTVLLFALPEDDNAEPAAGLRIGPGAVVLEGRF